MHSGYAAKLTAKHSYRTSSPASESGDISQHTFGAFSSLWWTSPFRKQLLSPSLHHEIISKKKFFMLGP